MDKNSWNSPLPLWNMGSGLEQILHENCILTEQVAEDYHQAIEILLSCLDKSGRVINFDACLKAIHQRESAESTIVQKGLAFPHACTTAISRPSAAVGVFHLAENHTNPLVVILTITPPGYADFYVKYLAHMAHLMADAQLMNKLCKMNSIEIHKVFC